MAFQGAFRDRNPCAVCPWRLTSTIPATIIALIFVLYAVSDVHAVNFNVGCGDVAELISALHNANNSPGDDTVVLAAGCTYSLTGVENYWYGPNGLPAITSVVTIDGNGATLLRAFEPGTPAFRFLYVAGAPTTALPAGTLLLRDVTLRNGLALGGRGADGAYGGGGGAGMGGAILNQGELTLERVTLSENNALGGDGGLVDSRLRGAGGGGGISGHGGVDGGGGAMHGSGTADGGDFLLHEGGQGVAGGQSTVGGDGGDGARSIDGAGGGGGGYSEDGTAANYADPGQGGAGGGNGGYGQPDSVATGGGGGAFGGGGAAGQGGGGGGVGGGGGSGIYSGGNGGFGGGGGGATFLFGGAAGFGGGGGGAPYGGDGNLVGGDGGDGGGGGAGLGGALFNHGGTVTIAHSALVSNRAAGGNGGNADVDGGVGGNGGTGLGGAIFNYIEDDGGEGQITVHSSTLAGNVAAGSHGGSGDSSADDGADGWGNGGAIFNYDGELILVNSTVSGNQADGHGGGIFEYEPENGATYLYSLTITENVADADQDTLGDGGGIYNHGQMAIHNTILAANADNSPGAGGDLFSDNHPDCSLTSSSGVFSATRYNLLGAQNGCERNLGYAEEIFTAVDGNIAGAVGDEVDAQLEPLTDNGGGTETHRIAYTSPARDAAQPQDQGGCRDHGDAALTDDQRGVPRPQGGRCDTGAVELLVGSIQGRKWEDDNGNRQWDEGESYLNGWTIDLHNAAGAVLSSTLTAAMDGQGDGWYRFGNLNAGTYIVTEQLRPGWEPTFPIGQAGHKVTVDAQHQDWTLNFGNAVPGVFRGQVWHDLDGDGVHDRGELGVNGWTIDLVDDGTGQVIDTRVTAETRDGAGWYVFESVEPGQYQVRQRIPDGWRQTWALDQIVDLHSGDQPVERNFGNVIVGSIHGFKFEDVDGDSVYDATVDRPAAGMQFSLTGVDSLGNTIVVPPTADGDPGDLAVSDDTGEFTFTDLLPGAYTIEEIAAPGWIPTTPMSVTTVLESGQAQVARAGQAKLGDQAPQREVVVGTGLYFGNTKLGVIQGRKWHDRNGNGVRDDGEPYLNGWEIQLLDADGNVMATTTSAGTVSEGASVTTTLVISEVRIVDGKPIVDTKTIVIETDTPPGADLGLYYFDSLPLGTYVVVETPPDNPHWVQSAPRYAADLIEVEYTDSPGSGAAWFSVDPAAEALGFDIIADGLDSPVTGVDIVLAEATPMTTTITVTDAHGIPHVLVIPVEGQDLVYSVVIPDLPPTGDRIQYQGSLALDGDLPDLLQAGRLYVSVRTEAHPDGELRGQILPNHTHKITVNGSATIVDRDFGNYIPGSVTGQKWHDVNANGRREDGEPGLNGWTIELVDARTNQVIDTQETDHAWQATVNAASGQTTVEFPWNVQLDIIPQGETDPVKLNFAGPATLVFDRPLGQENGTTFDLVAGNGDPLSVPSGQAYAIPFELIDVDLSEYLAVDSPRLSLGGARLRLRQPAIGTLNISADGSIVIGDSFFDVFFELEFEDGFIAYNVDPLRAGATFDAKDGLAADQVLDMPALFTVVEPVLALVTESEENPAGLVDWAQLASMEATPVRRGPGWYRFENMTPGSYLVREQLQDGWYQTVAPSGVFTIASSQILSGLDFANTHRTAGISLNKTVGIDPPVCASTGDIAVPQGTAVHYCLTVENTGQVTLTTYTVDDPILDPPTGLNVSFDYDLPPGDVMVLTGDVLADLTGQSGLLGPVVADDDIANTAVITGAFAGGAVGDQDSAFVSVLSAGIAVTKTVGTDPDVCASGNLVTVGRGADVYFCVTIANTGDVTMTRHTIDDPVLRVHGTVDRVLSPGTVEQVTHVDLPGLGPIQLTKSITNTVTVTSTNAPINLPAVNAAQAVPVPFAFKAATRSQAIVIFRDTSERIFLPFVEAFVPTGTDDPQDSLCPLFLPVVRR
jgi:hypothetical protein